MPLIWINAHCAVSDCSLWNRRRFCRRCRFAATQKYVGVEIIDLEKDRLTIGLERAEVHVLSGPPGTFRNVASRDVSNLAAGVLGIIAN